MIVGACQIRLHLPASHSLKEKRKIVRSLVERLRARFNLSVAEIEEQDRWQLAVLGLTSASRDGTAAHALLQQAADFVEEQAGDYVVLDVEIEIVPVF
jgi:uncharacterized protein YlxP (DUF503 family)